MILFKELKWLICLLFVLWCIFKMIECKYLYKNLLSLKTILIIICIENPLIQT